MDLRQLRYFVAISEMGSFSQAAHRLRIAQPALSQQIKRLEFELSAQLFRRTSRGAELTAQGETLLQGAKAILAQIDAVAAQVRRPHRAPDIRLGLPTVLSRSLARPLLHANLELKCARLRVVEGMGDALLEGLRAGRLEAAIVFDNQDLQDLVLTSVCAESTYLVGSARRHLPEHDIAFADIGAYPLVLGGHKHGLHKAAIAEASCRNIAVDVHLEIDVASEIKPLVMSGMGFTLLSPLGFGEEFLAGHLKATRVVRPCLQRTLMIACRPDAGDLVRAAITLIEKTIRDKSEALEEALAQQTRIGAVATAGSFKTPH